MPRRGWGRAGFSARRATRAHDLGDARLVIGSQKRGAVGDHQVLAHQIVQGGQGLGGDGDRPLCRLSRDKVAAGVGNHVRMHPGAADDLCCVEMGDQAQGGRPLCAGAGGKRGEHVRVLGHLHAFGTELLEFGSQKAREVKLAGARRD